MLAGNARKPLRDSLARAFQHSAMKKIAVAFSNRQIPPKLAYGMDRNQIQQSTADVASAFVQLQEARHDADYNRSLRFTRREVLDFADIADQAFHDWRQVRGSLPADTFLTGLLAYTHMQG